MNVFWRDLEQLGHGILLGACIGLLAGYVEYILYFVGKDYAGDFVLAYWDIMLSYAIIGAIGGFIVAVAIRLLRGHSPVGHEHFARLGTTFLALACFSYLALWITYEFLPKLSKPILVLAYLASVGFTIGFGMLFDRVLRRVGAWLGSGMNTRFRIRLPLLLLAVSAGVLFIPALFLYKTQTVPGQFVASAKDRAGQPRPNIVMILIDTLRADHLPMYGYSRQTAPNLSQLAQEGVLFTRMYAPSSSTRPSVATVFSSLYPAVHKVNHEDSFLPNAFLTLAEILHAAGYQTFGISANSNVSPTFGYAQGFETFRATSTERPIRMTIAGSAIEAFFRRILKRGVSGFFGERLDIVPKAEAITDITLQWALKHHAKPSFLYVHYVDPHAPYTPPAPYDHAFNYRDDTPRRAGGLDPISLLPPDRDRAEVRHTLDLYDGEILYNDQHIGRLLTGLRELGMLENALVIVMSDHGEEFSEHGKNGHGISLYEEVLHVPFLMVWPRQLKAGSTYDELAGLVDVMPTTLGLLGIKPPGGIHGLNLAMPLMAQTTGKPERKIFGQQVSHRYRLESVRHHRYKLIRYVEGPWRGRVEFYDIQRDPRERNNLAPQASSQVAAWDSELNAFRKATERDAILTPEERVGKLDEDTIKALRALGYIK